MDISLYAYGAFLVAALILGGIFTWKEIDRARSSLNELKTSVLEPSFKLFILIGFVVFKKIPMINKIETVTIINFLNSKLLKILLLPLGLIIFASPNIILSYIICNLFIYVYIRFTRLNQFTFRNLLF